MPNFRSLVPGGFYGDGTSGPVSIRANNPGAINGAAWERDRPGFAGNVKYDGRNDTTVFEAPEYGVAAWWELMRRYRDQFDVRTLSDIIRTYGGGQDYGSYARTVSQWSGLPPDRVIVLTGDDDNLLKFAKAMFRFEAGQPTPLSDAQILYGFAIGRNGGRLPSGSISQPTPSSPAESSRSGMSQPELAAAIVAAMERKGCLFDRGPGELNIVYVEGMNIDGTANDNAIDKWNDLRTIVDFVNGRPILRFRCEATTTPGIYYDREHVIGGPEGAALIALGQQRCWQVGIHRGTQEALVQTGAPVSVYRDFDKSFRRQEGHVTTGWYGINQHGTREGYDGSPNTVGPWSAGCLVARKFADHVAFMALVKSDPRYLNDHSFVFATTVLGSADVLAAVPPVAPPKPAPAPARENPLLALLRLIWKLLKGK
jgi:hypothetical protein